MMNTILTQTTNLIIDVSLLTLLVTFAHYVSWRTCNASDGAVSQDELEGLAECDGDVADSCQEKKNTDVHSRELERGRGKILVNWVQSAHVPGKPEQKQCPVRVSVSTDNGYPFSADTVRRYMERMAQQKARVDLRDVRGATNLPRPKPKHKP